jgi:hypothetical protein
MRRLTRGTLVLFPERLGVLLEKPCFQKRDHVHADLLERGRVNG